MLTNREVVRRINRWAKKPRAKVPVCYHNGSHGRLKAVILTTEWPVALKPDPKNPNHWVVDRKFGTFPNDEVVMACTQCNFKLLPHDLPETAFRKVA